MRSLAEVIERAAACTQSLADAGAPVQGDGICALCCVDTAEDVHDPDCGWVLARAMSGNDLNELRRLARVLRYSGSPVTP